MVTYTTAKRTIESFPLASPHPHSPSQKPPPGNLPGSPDRVSTLRFKSLGLTELVLGDALLVNSRCLRFLAQQRSRSQAVGAAFADHVSDSLLSDQEMLALRRCVARLGSHWRLLRDTQAGRLANSSLARMTVIASLIPPGSATGRAAKELLEQTEDPKRRAALREVMDQWLVSKRVRQVSAIDRDHLLELLEQDAAAWQEAVDQVDIGDSTALFNALKGCYRKPRRLARRLLKGSTEPDSNDETLTRLLGYVGRNVAQLELLRPGLSDVYTKQLWYLQRLERNLRRRLDLSAFERRLFAMDLRSDRLVKVQQRAQQAVKARGKVQAQRTRKLIALAYGIKPKAYIDGIAQDLSAMDEDRLKLSDSHLDTLSATHGDSGPINLGDITVEEPQD